MNITTEVINVVDELNNLLFEQYGIEETPFNMFYSTFEIVILFREEILWSHDNDERVWFEESSSYEPLLPFITKKYNQFIKDLKPIKNVKRK